jgi:hypothetical protein
MLFAEAGWPEIHALRERIEQHKPRSVQDAGQNFASVFCESFSSLVLARVFLVMPFARLPAADQAFARTLVANDPRLAARTPTLSLLGTYGHEQSWRDRTRSKGHLAIPLLDKAFVSEIPMIAKLLGDLDFDLASLNADFGLATSPMAGAGDGKFFVADAETTVDARGRHIIPNREFVSAHRVRTVFGMGGSYFDGTLAVSILFTDERLEQLVTDRYASFIGTFKITTTKLHQNKSIY